MSRTLTLIIVAIVALVAFFLLRTFDETSSPVLQSADPENQAAINPDFRDWRPFTPSSGQFQAALPGLPQEVYDKITDQQTGEQRKYNTVIAADPGGAAFMISAITFSRNVEVDPDDDSLKTVVTDILSRNKENKLNFMRPGTYQNSRALDFSIASGDMVIEGKVFAHGKIVYVLSMLSNSIASYQNDYDFFLNNFKLTPSAATQEKGNATLPNSRSNNQ